MTFSSFSIVNSKEKWTVSMDLLCSFHMHPSQPKGRGEMVQSTRTSYFCRARPPSQGTRRGWFFPNSSSTSLTDSPLGDSPLQLPVFSCLLIYDKWKCRGQEKKNPWFHFLWPLFSHDNGCKPCSINSVWSPSICQESHSLKAHQLLCVPWWLHHPVHMKQIGRYLFTQGW